MENDFWGYITLANKNSVKVIKFEQNMIIYDKFEVK